MPLKVLLSALPITILLIAVIGVSRMCHGANENPPNHGN